MMRDFALLTLRFTIGALLAGHGAQKLFGWFGGYGLKGTAGWLESVGLRPGRIWAPLAGLSEFGGGVLSMLGLFHPVGPFGIAASMSMATATVHWGRPIWVTAGGAELPLTNTAVVLALLAAGPGRYSLDGVLGIRLSPAATGFAAALTAAGIVAGITVGPARVEAPQRGGASAS